MKTIATSGAPAAIGPYSQAKISGNLIYTSGSIPVDPTTGIVIGSNIGTQAEQTILNLKAILEAAGSSLKRVIKTTCFLTEMQNFAAFNEVYATYFTESPARTCVAVKALPKGVLCEIDAIAEL